MIRVVFATMMAMAMAAVAVPPAPTGPADRPSASVSTASTSNALRWSGGSDRKLRTHSVLWSQTVLRRRRSWLQCRLRLPVCARCWLLAALTALR